MRLHRYFGSHADVTLRDGLLMFSSPSSFNDPFETLYRYEGEWTISSVKKLIKRGVIDDALKDLFFREIGTLPNRLEFRRWKSQNMLRLCEFYLPNLDLPEFDPRSCLKESDELYRLCCFTGPEVSPADEILLWSHYAKKHEGVRIEFEFYSGDDPVPWFLHQVEYSQHRVGINATRVNQNAKIQSGLMAALITKAESWKYENEWRIILPRQSMVADEKERYFLSFDPTAVKSVDFGINCPLETNEKVKTILKAQYPHAQMRMARHHRDDFAIEYEPVK
jgi:hypothetical protein